MNQRSLSCQESAEKIVFEKIAPIRQCRKLFGVFMSRINYASICSGIEAATSAWRPLGIQAAWYAEIEPFPCAVLAHHYPNTPNHGDMTHLAAKVLAGSIPAPDLLVGGTPCQAFSVAGMRAGLADPRGALTIKYVELLDAIDHVRTRRGEPNAVCLWENVPGVLSDKGNAFGCFLGALVGESEELQPPGGKWKDAGCVYGPRRTAAWRILDAQYFGLAQRRRRVFVVASARKGFDPVEVLFERESLRRDNAPSRGQGQNPARHSSFGPTAQCEDECSYDRGNDSGACLIEGVAAFGGHSISGPIEQAATLTTKATRLDAESETFVVATAVVGTLRSTDGGSDVDHAMAGHLVSGTLNANGKAAGSATQQDAESGLLVVHGTQDPCISDKAFAIGRNSGQENVLAFARKDRDAIEGNRADDNGQLAACHAGDVAHAIQAGATRLNPSSGPDGVGVQADHAYTLEARAEVQAVQLQSQVRRLTPRECERLQGFPDDYTLIPYRGKPAAQCPDGPRYKAIGNSKAVPVVRWIGHRILKQL